MEKEYERVRESVESRSKLLEAEMCWLDKDALMQGFICPNIDCHECFAKFGVISLVEIKSDDQSLQPPESISFELNPESCGDTLMVSPMGIALKDNLLNAYEQAQQDMLKAGFIRVIPKRK